MSVQHRTLVSVLLFKASWVLLVIWQNQALFAAVLLQLCSVLINPQQKRILTGVLPLALAGFLLEQVAVLYGVISLNNASTLYWLGMLWFSFVLALTHGLGFLARLPVWGQVVIGACLGPIAYVAANKLGAVGFGLPVYRSLLILSIGWAAFLPLALRMLRQDMRLQSAIGQQLCVVILALFTLRAEAEQSLLGQGSLSFLFMPIYDAWLYGASASDVYPPRGNFSFKLEYHRKISADALLSETLRQWQKQQIAVKPHWQESLGAILPDVQAGDTLELVVDHSKLALLKHNGNVVGTIEDNELLTAFTGIWLAENTTRPQLRSALLGTQ